MGDSSSFSNSFFIYLYSTVEIFQNELGQRRRGGKVARQTSRNKHFTSKLKQVTTRIIGSGMKF